MEVTQRHTCFDDIAVVTVPGDSNTLIDLSADLVEPGSAGEFHCFTRDDGSCCRLAGGNQFARDVASANVLSQCGLYVACDFFDEFCIHSGA